MNRFMKKFKTVYCKASFVFAVAVLIVTFSLCIFNPTSVAASQTTSGSDISTDDVTKDLEDVTSMDAGDKDLVRYLHLSACFWGLPYFLLHLPFS